MVPTDLYMRCPELTASMTTYTTKYSSLYANNDALVNYWITAVTHYFDVTRWGNYLLDGMIWRVAHEISNMLKWDEDLDQATDGLGVNRVRIGAENTDTRNLAVKESDQPFMATKYGQRYLQLRKMIGMGAVAT